MRVARERKSSVLASNAVHHRVDSLTSIVALVAIGGSHLIPGATWLDPVCGLVVSGMVIQAGAANALSAVYELCDRSMDEEVKASVLKAARKADVEKGVEVRDVQGVKAGQNYLVDIEVAVPTNWSLDRSRKAEEAIRSRVGSKVRGVRRVRVRLVPAGNEEDDFQSEFIGADVSPRNSPEPESEQHDHDHDHGHEDRSYTKKPNGKAKKR